jgi:hypothetical protein
MTFEHPVTRRPAMRQIARPFACAALACSILLPGQVAAQDFNYSRPIVEIERLLQYEPFSIVDWRGSRMPQDRTQRVAMQFTDSIILAVKWATAPPGGAEFNNEPRYELAAYRLQTLFLDSDDYVVPPTVIRAFPLSFVREQVPAMQATFRAAPASVLVSLQYWLSAVSPESYWNQDRLATDSVYERHIANMNILTYLIRHSDSNVGNFLISQDPQNPRVFSIDNGVSFDSPPSNRGYYWRTIRVRRLPARAVERLAALTREDLDRALGVLVEFEVHDGQLVQVEPGANMDARTGVRIKRDRIQLGLTAREITGVQNRIRDLLKQTDGGRYQIF